MILERLRTDLVLGDGGYVLELERRGYIQAGPFTPQVVLDFPEAVAGLHREFRRAGAEVLQALTFYGGEAKLASVGRQSDCEELHRRALELARGAADGALVAGGLTLSPGAVNQAALERQARLQGDADFIIGETFLSLAEAQLALKAILAAGKTAMITMNIGPQGSSDGFSPAECARRLAGEGAAIVGVNCSYDPRLALEVAATMREACEAFVACQPVGYWTGDTAFTSLPDFPLSLEPRQLTRFDMAAFARRGRELGLNYLGGCCGVGAHHLRAMAEELGRRPPASAVSPDMSLHVMPEVRARWA